MKLALAVIVTATLAATSLASAQTNSPNSGTEQNAPGSGGMSKPGTAGLPGSKAGPAVTPSGSGSSSGTDSNTTRQRDQSNVPGAPGNKSGTADPSKYNHPEVDGNHPGL